MSVFPPVWTTASGSDELQLQAQLLTPPWPCESEHSVVGPSITRPHCPSLPNEQHMLWAVTGIVAQTEEISRSHLARLKKKIKAGKVSPQVREAEKVVNGSKRPLWLLLLPHVSGLLNPGCLLPTGNKASSPAARLRVATFS